MTSDAIQLAQAIESILTDPVRYAGAVWPSYKPRTYQEPFMRSVAQAVETGEGGVHSVVFARQSGKDEALAQLLSYLAALYRIVGGEIVVGFPAMEPQGKIAMNRVLARLDNPITGSHVSRQGNVIQVGNFRIHYVSAAPTANARGHTASRLLVCNEAQDVDPDHWDAVFAPMAAAYNATTLFIGTVWTSDTLLARSMRLSQESGTLHRVAWRDVAAVLPAYGDYVKSQIAQLGEHHPFIRTEYELEELDQAGRLFNDERQQILQGEHTLLRGRQPGERYVLTVDVAGADESLVEGERITTGQRDSTAANVWRVQGVGERYELVHRYEWVNRTQRELHERLQRIARDVWKVQALVIDATGIGAGLTSFLTHSLGEDVVIPFVFSQSSKSRLGWDFVGMIESGRVSVGKPGKGLGPLTKRQTALDRSFWEQAAGIRYSIRPGPNRVMSWQAPQGEHDDLIISAALIAAPELTEVDWRDRTARGR